MKRIRINTVRALMLVLSLQNEIVLSIPAQVMLIRHGEKDKNLPVDNNLSFPRGYVRSHALVPLFVDMPLAPGGFVPKNAYMKDGKPMMPALYGQPIALYSKGQKHLRNSDRSTMTLMPIAHELGLEVIQISPDGDDCDKKDPKKYEHCYMGLVREIMENPVYEGKLVLIAWEHNAIPTIAQAFITMYTDGATLPDDLADPKMFKKYDRIYVLTFKKGMLKKIDNLAQRLLRGDDGSSTNRTYKVNGNKIVEEKKAA